MRRHSALVFCCFTVAVAASERSPAKVRIHHERSTQAELIASVEALGKTHHLKLKRTSMPSVPVHEVRKGNNGTVTIIEITGNETRSYYGDEETGAFLFMNNENTLEGMVSDSVALHYDNNEHTASEVNQKTVTPFDDVSHKEQMNDLPIHIERSRLQTESKYVSYVVEVVAVADSTLFNYKGNYFVEYMQVYWKMVDRRFRTVVGATISIRLTSIMYSSSTTTDSLMMDATEFNYAQLYTSKMKFAAFLASQQNKIARFDVGHLMTRRDLFEWENVNRYLLYTGSVIAIGYPCHVTSEYAYNSGISEDNGLWSGTLNTARIIANNLGSYNDGEGTSTSCSSTWGHIMSNVRNSYKTFWFSSCSSAAMIKVFSCYYTGCLKTIENTVYHVYPNYIAGNFHSLNTQCQWATQVSNAIADPTVSASAQCFRLRCRYVTGITTWAFTSGYPALEGTPCSTGGFCKDGYCQASWVG